MKKKLPISKDSFPDFTSKDSLVSFSYMCTMAYIYFLLCLLCIFSSCQWAQALAPQSIRKKKVLSNTMLYMLRLLWVSFISRFTSSLPLALVPPKLQILHSFQMCKPSPLCYCISLHGDYSHHLPYSFILYSILPCFLNYSIFPFQPLAFCFYIWELFTCSLLYTLVLL